MLEKVGGIGTNIPQAGGEIITWAAQGWHRYQNGASLIKIAVFLDRKIFILQVHPFFLAEDMPTLPIQLFSWHYVLWTTCYTCVLDSLVSRPKKLYPVAESSAVDGLPLRYGRFCLSAR